MNAELKEMVVALLAECEAYRRTLCAIEKVSPDHILPVAALRLSNVEKLAAEVLNRYRGNVANRNGRRGDQSSCMSRIAALLAEEP